MEVEDKDGDNRGSTYRYRDEGSHPKQGDHSHRHGWEEVSGAGSPGEGPSGTRRREGGEP